MSDPVLSAQGKIFFVSALARAAVIPFTPEDWSGYAGAEGSAHMIHFTPHDLVCIADELGIQDWVSEERCVVILDENGITFNTMLPGCWVGALTIDLSVSDWEAPPTKEELDAEREKKKIDLHTFQRAYVLGVKSTPCTSLEGRGDLHDYYGKIVDREIPEPESIRRGRHIQHGIKEPKYD